MGKRVLVADDSATIQKAFTMVLAGQDGVSLVPARSYDEAVTAARQGRPDLVIADIVLGNRTGYDLCAALKADPAFRGVPVYILASSQTPYDEARGRQAGADGHLLKPFESQSLIDRVQEGLSRPAVPAPAPARPVSTAPPVAAASPPVGARSAAAAVMDDLDDEYGEFTIERSSPGQSLPSAPVAVAAPVLAPPAPTPPLVRPGPTAPTPSPVSPFSAPQAAPPTASAGSGAALRPSLIPGARPGPAARPQVSVASASAAPPTAAAHRPASAPLPKRPEIISDKGGIAAAAAHAGIGRTIMGLPAVAIPGMPGSPREPRTAPPTMVPAVTPPPAAPIKVTAAPAAAPAMPAPVPVTPGITPIAPSRPSAGAFPLAPVPAADSASLVSARIDQKVAAIAARGPEFEAIAKLSREVIEQVVWEVVPELAEAIIREHVERLANARK